MTTNADDICAELAAARAYITRGDYREKPAEMPVSWGYRYEAGGLDDGDWRSHGIA